MSIHHDVPPDRVARFAAIAAVIGCLAVAVTDATTVLLVDDLNFIANTISNAAAGRHAWVQDTGLCLFGLGLFALAYALRRTGSSDWQRWASSLAVAVVGAAIIVLALHDEYGDGDPGGWVFHTELVYLIGSVMLIPMAVQASPFGEVKPLFKPLSWCLFALWLVGGPLLFQVPDAITGLYERGLAGIMLAWVLMAAAVLWACGRDRKPPALDGADLSSRTSR